MKLDAFETSAITNAIRSMSDLVTGKLDAAGIWTVEQLKQILNRRYEEEYPETSVTELFPVTTEIAATTRTFEYMTFDGVTMAKIIADYADDLPVVDATHAVETGRVFRFGNAWTISIDEIKTGAALGSSLSDRKSSLAREGHVSLLNDLVFKGSAPHKIVSVFSNPNIPKITSATGAWADSEKASDELQSAIDQMESASKGKHKVNTILIPPSMRRILGKRMPDTTESYLDWFMGQNKNVTISAIAELEDIDGQGTKAVLAYDKNPLNMSIEIPEAFNMLPMQPKDLHFKVPCTSKATGLIVYRPLALIMIVGVGK